MKVIKQFLFIMVVALSVSNLYAPEVAVSRNAPREKPLVAPKPPKQLEGSRELPTPVKPEPQKPQFPIKPSELEAQKAKMFNKEFLKTVDTELKEEIISQQNEDRLQTLLRFGNKSAFELTTAEQEAIKKDHIEAIKNLRNLESDARKELSEILSSSERALMKNGLKLTFEMVKNNFDASAPQSGVLPKELTDEEEATLEKFTTFLGRNPKIRLYYDAFVKVYEKALDLVSEDNNPVEIDRIRTVLHNFSSVADEITLFSGLTELCETVIINKEKGLSGNKIVDINSFLSGRKAFEKTFKQPDMKLSVSITHVDVTKEQLQQSWNKFSQSLKDAVSFVSKKISELKQKASYKSDRKKIINTLREELKNQESSGDQNFTSQIETATDLLKSLHRALLIGKGGVSISRELMTLRSIELGGIFGEKLIDVMYKALNPLCVLESPTFPRPLDAKSKEFIKDIVTELSQKIDTLTYGSKLTSEKRNQLITDIAMLCDQLSRNQYTTSDVMYDAVKPSGPLIYSSVFANQDSEFLDSENETDDDYYDEWDDQGEEV